MKDFCVNIKLKGKAKRKAKRLAAEFAKATMIYIKEFSDGRFEITDKL